MKESSPLISIIIVTFNNQYTILSTLDSLPWQQLDVEVIVIDNHSSDQTISILTNYAELCQNPHRVILNKQNRYYATAVNQGLCAARGDFVAIIGPDVTLLPLALKNLHKTLIDDNTLGAVAPQLLSQSGQIQASCRRLPQICDLIIELSGLPRLFPQHFNAPWKMAGFDHNTQRYIEQPETSCLLIKREALKDISGMDTRFSLFFNDVDLCRRLGEAGWHIAFQPEAKATHVKGASIYTYREISIWKSHQGFYRYLKKYSTNTFSSRLFVWILGWLLIVSALYRWLAIILWPDLTNKI